MHWTLDQIQLFIACAEQGSFSAAARHLGRAQSAVSTGISHLELDLDCELFDRRSRSPTLTAAGHALLPEARAVQAQCERLNARAATLAQGEEAQLVVAMHEALIEMPPVDATLEALAEHYPALSLTLLYGAQGDVAEWVEQGTAHLGILLSQVHAAGPLEGSRIAHLKQRWVVGSTHPLAQQAAVTPSALASYRQLMMASRHSEATAPPHVEPCLSPMHWRLNSFYSMAELTARGLGWSLVPEHVADYPPFRDKLQTLTGPGLGEPPSIEVETVIRRDAAKGPIARWLVATLGENFRAVSHSLTAPADPVR
ncbi:MULTISPECIES: LysR family transcriptional regulator [unclassified Halomonas]|uniref:LysR family transcriptional regulator n=1 Tax=unclassified Halomonas TaxID=2609666 RepID=UPI001C96EE82|nr:MULTISPECIES: LysR family transcriptional regulator [unclassified Halomonas]MBY5926377.1 LysR family transcriptional regulator [Halomonas sp. DP4Y7-2]MBY5930044.1 LysR family transcriptional regulator [Halomonas sp. DP8Y7-3]MBY6233419.1 LysR family transcriptional regulator [Halomonas sp. DP4Y7-1]